MLRQFESKKQGLCAGLGCSRTNQVVDRKNAGFLGHIYATPTYLLIHPAQVRQSLFNTISGQLGSVFSGLGPFFGGF